MSKFKQYLSVLFLCAGVILTHQVSAQVDGAFTTGQVRKVD